MRPSHTRSGAEQTSCEIRPMRLGRQSVQTTRCAYIDRKTGKQPLVASCVRRLAINEPKRIACGPYAFYTLYRVAVAQTDEIFHILRQPGRRTQRSTRFRFKFLMDHIKSREQVTFVANKSHSKIAGADASLESVVSFRGTQFTLRPLVKKCQVARNSSLSKALIV